MKVKARVYEQLYCPGDSCSSMDMILHIVGYGDSRRHTCENPNCEYYGKYFKCRDVEIDLEENNG